MHVRKTSIFSIFPTQRFLQGKELAASSDWSSVSAYNPVHQRMRQSCDRSPFVKEDELAPSCYTDNQMMPNIWLPPLTLKWLCLQFKKIGEVDGLDDDHTKCLTRFNALWHHNLTEESHLFLAQSVFIFHIVWWNSFVWREKLIRFLV